VACYAVDVSDNKAVVKAVKKIMSQQKHVDLLFNNAGVASIGTSEIEPEHFEQMVKINLLGMYYWVHAIAPYMKKQKEGLIVNLGSRSGIYAREMVGGYAATKFGVVGFSEALYRELATFGVKVTTINPGFVATDMTSQSSFDQQKMIPPEDIAKVVESLLQLSALTVVKSITLTPIDDVLYV